MKIIDIALKDITRSFRSVFAVLFMFVIPLVVTGMFYIMFGGMANNDTGFSLPQTKVMIANLDAGGTGFETAMSQFPADANIHSMGDMVVYVLQDKSFSDLMQVTLADSAEAARSAVDAQEAGVAVIIPADFTERLMLPGAEDKIRVEVYRDVGSPLAAEIVYSITTQMVNGMASGTIAAGAAARADLPLDLHR